MQGENTREPSASLPDGALWQRSRVTDAGEDDAERLLDLAAFADRRLDADDEERVAGWLAEDPFASDDVAAARTLAARARPVEAASEAIIARAVALVPGVDRGNVILFVPRPRLRNIARWSGLAAAMAVASWLGFTLGMDTSLSLAQLRQGGDDGFLRELVDPSPGFLRELTEGAQT